MESDTCRDNVEVKGFSFTRLLSTDLNPHDFF